MRLGLLKVDFVPDDPSILGFSNRWYATRIETAVSAPIGEDLIIRRLTPELFVATKLEAYLGRGEGDLLPSRDLEDILLVFDGRPAIVSEILRADREIRTFIARQFERLLDHADFESFLEGNIRGPKGRVDIIRNRFDAVKEDRA